MSAILDGQRPQDRVSENCHRIDAEIDANGLEICSDSLEGQCGRIACGLAATAQIDKHEPEAIAHLPRHLLLIKLRADGARHETNGTRAARRVEQLSTID
jgi:hypothetical protein